MARVKTGRIPKQERTEDNRTGSNLSETDLTKDSFAGSNLTEVGRSQEGRRQSKAGRDDTATRA